MSAGGRRRRREAGSPQRAAAFGHTRTRGSPGLEPQQQQRSVLRWWRRCLAGCCRGFRAIANRLIVGPILRVLVFGTTPALARAWVDSICRDWEFRQIIPAHFTAPIPATPADLRAAFAFAYEDLPGAAAEGEAPASGANPARALDGLLLGLLRGGGGGAKRAAVARTERAGVEYPADDIAALTSARRFLEGAGVVDRPS